MLIIYVIYTLIIGLLVFCVVKKINFVEKKNQEIKSEAAIANQIYTELVQNGYSDRKINHELQKQKMIVMNLPPNATTKDVVKEIIANRREKMNRLGIIYTEDVKDLHILNMSQRQTLSLFINLFDNAIEACTHVTHHRKICFSTSYEGGNFSIEIINSKSPELSPVKEEFHTTKEDSLNHGYGMGIIKEIIESQSGKIEYEDMGEKFKIKIVLPIE